MESTPPSGSHSKPAQQSRLSATDWAEAALTAIGENGLAGVAVEPLAARLGATKGSFYWHFANRRALIEAALQLWEHEHTEAIIAQLENEPDPTERLRQLFAFVVGVSRHDQIEVALLASANDPLVAPAMRRATDRRISYVASLYEELGLPAGEAQRQAVLAVSVYLGHVQLAHAAPASLPTDDAGWQSHIDHVVTTLLGP